MDVASVAIVVAALCVSFGWQPSQDDPQAYEVLMQVEPELVDSLHDSPQLAIESHVPASITPIRNIRVLVGTDELPRTPVASSAEAKSKSERIVRGQEPAGIERTASFQGDDGWSGDRYQSGGGIHQFDQRGPTIGTDPIRTAQANPWTLDSAPQAASDAGNSLRDSFNSGVQQMDQRGQRILNSAQNSAQNASRDFGQELQNMSGFGGTTSTPPAAGPTAAARKSWAPPPLAVPQSTTTDPTFTSGTTNGAITPDTWTSIRSEFAPPRLAPPPLSNGLRVASSPTTTRSTASGPSFPPPPSNGAPPLHSVLSDPAAASRTSDTDWSSVWGTGSSTSSAAEDAGVGLEPVPPRPRTSVASAPTAPTNSQNAFDPWPTTTATPATISSNSNSSAPPAGDRYRQSAPAAPAANGADEWANFDKPRNNGFDNRPSPAAPTASQSAAQPNQAFGPNSPAISTQAAGPATGQQSPKGEEVPWRPLLGVSLALAGSVGANFFLGMSYADARRRYRSLVAKTTHAFQKEAGIAA